jgi:hypothetical protein
MPHNDNKFLVKTIENVEEKLHFLKLFWWKQYSFAWYISSLDIHWIEFSIDFWKLVKNPKNAGGECVKFRLVYLVTYSHTFKGTAVMTELPV